MTQTRIHVQRGFDAVRRVDTPEIAVRPVVAGRMDERSCEFVVGDLAERDRHPVVVFGKSVGAEFAAAELRRPSSVADAADPLVARQLDIDDAPCAEEERIVGFEVDPPVEPVSRPGGHGDARPAFGVAEIEHVAVPDAGAGALRDDDSLDGNPVVGEAGRDKQKGGRYEVFFHLRSVYLTFGFKSSSRCGIG